jgi:K+-sensing histidine kinase KdpD
MELEFDSNLLQERTLADKTLQSTRRRIDSLLLDSSTDVSVEQAQLHRMREIEDFDIVHERTQTNEATLNNHDLLTEERLAHIITRGTVTTRDELLAIVSHDLRSPLCTIDMAAQLLLEQLKSPTIK